MKRFRLKKLNNEGAALILAMVIVLFITVLTSLLLYVSGINYEMKTTDYRIKVSFYGAETPLEELKVQLAVDTSTAAEAAYKHVMANFSLFNAGQRQSEFENTFYEEIEKIWEARGVTDMRNASQWMNAIGSVLTNTDYDIYTSSQAQTMGKPYHIEIKEFDMVNGVQGTTLERDEPNGRILLMRIKVYYKENDFLSVISTDFAMDIPDIDWSVEGNDNTVPNVTAADATPMMVNFEDCVSYINWEKQ